MKPEEAIRAHERWKAMLTTYLKNPDGAIDAGQLEADDKCELGQWIHGEGAKHFALPEYAALRTVHADFHRVAAKVVRSANLAPIANADAMLRPTSDYGAASASVVDSIKALARKLS